MGSNSKKMMIPTASLHDVLSLGRQLGLPDSTVEALLILSTKRLRFQTNRQLVELPCESERHLVVLVVHRRAGVDADIKGFVNRHEKRYGVGNPFAGHSVSVNGQHAVSAFTETGTVVFEVKHDSVLARREGW